jgi:hypothetical protein
MFATAKKVILLVLCVVIMPWASGQSSSVLYMLDDPEPDFGFGDVVSAIGDVDRDSISDLAVASPYKEVDGSDGQGQVSVFSGADGSLLYTTNLPNYFRNANFGSSIAGLGDINGDAFSDFAIGATGFGRGRVFVYSGATGTLQYVLASPSGVDAGAFGNAIAAIGDIDGDDVSDFVVGDREDRGGFVFPDQPQGKVFMYSGASGNLIRTIENPLPDPNVAQLFGEAVSGVGDVNADNVPDFVVGAWQQVSGGVVSGRAFVYSGADGALLHSLDQPTRQHTAEFGRNLAVVGDLNGDSVADIVVSATGQDALGIERQGQAYAFSGSDGSLLYVIDHPIPGTWASLFGESVGAVGNIDNDSVPDFVISATRQNDERGQAYILSGVDGALLAVLDDSTLQPGALFGKLSQVAVGDLNGDRCPEVAVGAGRQQVGSNDSQGRVFVFSIACSQSTEISIDIKPGNKRNVINPRARGGTWVAILSDTNGDSPFDPLSQVDIPTMEFGPDGAKALRYKVKDKNRDGLGDVLLRFKIRETGIACGDTEATLIGKTFDGQRITGTDTVKTVGCNKGKNAKNKKNMRK